MRDKNNALNKPAQPKTPTVITPKWLAWEFGLDQHTLRRLLRRHFRKRKNYYWKFEGAEAKQVREYLLKARANGRVR
jgi:hypothetical protein